MGNGGYLGSAIDDFTGQSRQSRNEGGSPDTFETEDFPTWNGDALSSGQWVDLAVYPVEAQTEYNVGYGTAAVESTVGRFFAAFEDGSGNAVSGQVRIKTRDANDGNVDTEISSISTARLNSNENDYTKQVAVPEVTNTPKVGEDSKIVVQFKLSSNSQGTSADQAASTMLFDATRFD